MFYWTARCLYSRYALWILKAWSYCPWVEKMHIWLSKMSWTSFHSFLREQALRSYWEGKRGTVSDSQCLVTYNLERPETIIFSRTFVLLLNLSLSFLSSHLEPAYWAHLPLVKHLSLNNSAITTNCITSKFKTSLMKLLKNWWVKFECFVHLERGI